MSVEKIARYVFIGAGAIGAGIGGLLVHRGARVFFVARPAQAEAIRNGFTIRQDSGDLQVRAEAVTSISDIDPQPGDCVLIATKSQSTAEVVEELAQVYDRATPIVCLQNGVRNEEIAARHFDNVYAAMLLMSAVQITPEVVTMPRGRTIAIGRYPEGVDEIARQLGEALADAGFEVLVTAYAMAEKWGKLIANLNNATHAITDYWLDRSLAEPRMRALMVAVRDEGLRVLEAAGIAVAPPPGEPSAVKIFESTEAMRRPPSRPPDLDLPEDRRTYPSMWQDLHLGRRTTEAEFLNGEIVALGKKVGMKTPYNSTLLEVITYMAEAGIKPGLLTPEALEARIEAAAAGRPGPPL